MKSFAHCLKKHGLDKFERELLTTRTEALLAGKDASDRRQAALMAVNAYESDLLDRRDAIHKEVGMEPLVREPAPELSAADMQEKLAAQGKKNNANMKRAFRAFGIELGERSDITGEKGKGARLTGAMPGTFRRDGRAVDEWARVLVENDWLQPESQSERGGENLRASMDDTRAFIRNVLDGNPIFKIGDNEAYQAAAADAAAQVDNVTAAELEAEADPKLDLAANAAAFNAAAYLESKGLTGAEAESIIEEASRYDDDEQFQQAVIDAATAATRGREESARAVREEAPGLELQGQTNAEVAAAEEKAKADAAAAAKVEADAAAKEKEERVKAEVRQRSQAAADTFELGGNAEDNLSGQGGLLDEPTPQYQQASRLPNEPYREYEAKGWVNDAMNGKITVDALIDKLRGTDLPSGTLVAITERLDERMSPEQQRRLLAPKPVTPQVPPPFDSLNKIAVGAERLSESGTPRLPLTARIAEIARLMREDKVGLARIKIVQLLESKTAANDRAAQRRGEPRQRGELWINEKLLRAVRHGDISREQADLALWLLRQNPSIADDLAISIRSKFEEGTAGQYNPLARVMTLVAGRGSETTAVHELLHHTERLMPPAVQQGIRQAWARDLTDFESWGQGLNLPDVAEVVADVLRYQVGDLEAGKRIREKLIAGDLPISFYRLTSPSEYWAEHAAELVRDRAEWKPGWIATARQWLREFIEKIKDLFGLPSTASIVRGLDSVLAGDGSYQSNIMLGQITAGALTRSQQGVVASPDIRFAQAKRRAPLSKAADVEKWIAPLIANWKGAKIHVLQSLSDMPYYDELVQKGNITPNGIYAGLYVGSGRDVEVFLFADAIRDAKDAQFTAAHEMLGHYGIGVLLGDRTTGIMEQIYRDNAWVKAEADKKSKDFGYDIAVSTEEVLADMAGNFDQLRQLTGFQLFVAAVRSALRSLGFTVRMTEQDIAALLQNARRYVTGPGAELERMFAAKQPLFSQRLDGIMGPIKQEILDRFAYDGKSMSWINKTINTQFHKAETNAWFRPVFQGVQRFIADVNSFANDAAEVAGEDVLPRLRNFSDVGFNPLKVSAWKKTFQEARQLRRDLKAVGQVVWAGTLLDKRPTDDDLANGFSAPVKNTKGDRIGSVQSPALTPQQIEHYQRVRRALDLSLDQAVASEMVKLARESALEKVLPDIEEARQSAKDDPQNAANILTTALRERLQTIEVKRTAGELTADEADKYKATTEATITAIEEKSALAQKLQDEGYAPLMRFGHYTVKVMVPEVRVSGMKENVLYFGMFESKNDANKMGREMLAELQQDNPDAVLVHGTMDTEAWKQMRGLSLDTLDAFARITGMDRDEAVQDYIKMATASRSALKRLIHRKGIQGYDEDIQRVLATFITSQARLAARNYHFGEITKAIADIPTPMGDVKTEASKLAGYVQNPGEEAQGIRGFLFTQFLGGSIASALTNITQPILMTLPYLSQFGNPATATAALGKALGVVAKGTATDANLREAMELAAKEGHTEPQEVHQLYAESIRSGLGGRNLAARKALRVWGSLFSLSESFNRKITFVAAFELARQPGALQTINAKRAAENRSEFESAYEFAVHAIDDTQGIYNKGNRPNWARGPIGATAFTFKQFSIAYVEFLTRLPPREKALALAILVFAAGAEGLPFEDDLVDLWDTIWQALGFASNAKKSIRSWATKTLGEAAGGFLTGGVSALPGSPVDVSGRLGVGNLIPGTALFARSTQDATREVAQAVGPVGSLLMSARQAFSAAEEGQFKSAAYNVVPKAVRDMMQAVDMHQTGYYRDLKGRRTIATTEVDAAFKAIGLMPYDVTKEAQARQDIQQDIALHNVVEASIADRWARGIFEKDPAEVQAAIKDLFAWNLRNPTMPIAITPAQIRQRVQAALLPAEQRLMKQTPREIRGQEFPR